MAKLKQYQQHDLAEISLVLASAFRDYEVMRYLFSDSDHYYQQHVQGYFHALLSMSLANNWPRLGIYTEGQWVAATIAYHSSSADVVAGSDKALQQFCQQLSPHTQQRIDYYESRADAAHPSTPHFFIDSLGCLPQHEGKGYAKILLQALQQLSLQHPNASGVCLNTESSLNLPVYQRVGYKIISTQTISSLTSWCLFKADSD
ncbi:GNAT family N-acetyltransferase [Dasania marina]|uniref:GNAT family N-acetyltransferase n=1 Tax=Dasania marina TaxID=471499 RepID=UPI0003744662|nr:GNAT family N-acetyltransferase [Dasania marina]